MIITQMELQHISQVAELERLCFSDPWSEKSVAAELEHDYSLWLVVLEGETVVGYIGSQTSFGETDMMNVAVRPDCRRRGIGEKLILALMEELKARESHSLTLEVRASNESAITLYHKLGFSQIGLRKNYYRNPREDALILQKVL